MSELGYGFRTSCAGTVEEVEARVREALQAEGFGVLTEIDVAATFAAKLGLEFPQYKILGACNPKLAHAAITEEQDIGLLLPCNVIVYDDGEGGATVSILDPVQQLAVSGRTDMDDFALEVRARMERVIGAL